MPQSKFKRHLNLELFRTRFTNYNDNWDTSERGPEPPAAPPVWRESAFQLKQLLKGMIKGERQSLSAYLRPIKHAIVYYFLPHRYFRNELIKQDEASFLYDLLGDRASRNLLVKLCAFRILGHRKVKLSRNTPKYWHDIEGMSNYDTGAPPIKISFMDLSLSLFDFAPLGYKLKTYATLPGSACIFVQKQYEYSRGQVRCKAESGDIAIDGGGCWGESTLYFAHEVGPNGQVVSFEFVPSNLQIMEKNRENNCDLAKRITLLKHPLWEYSGEKLYYVDWGPGSTVTEDEKRYNYDGMCETISIDDVVAQKQLPSVDFIKMDIEGAELPALRGAERSLKSFRPKLAISIYHRPDDFVTIPRYLSSLGLEYDFYLDRHTIYQNETVLFAMPRKRKVESLARKYRKRRMLL